MLLTVKWADIPGLKDYISFALTVFSLGLAIIAIIYSMYSNSSLASSLNLLESSSHKLSSTSATLANSTERLSDTVTSIPQAIQKVESRVSETHDIVKKLELSSPPITSTGKVSNELSESFIDDFIKALSYNGLMTLYLMNFSYRNRVTVVFSEDVLGVMEVDEEYNFASYIVMKAMGLYKVKEKGGYFAVDFHPYINNVIDNVVIDKIEELFAEEDEVIEEVKESFYKFKSYLESEFGVRAA